MPPLCHKLRQRFPVALQCLVLLMILILQLGAPTPGQSQTAPDGKVKPVLGKGATAAEVLPQSVK